MHLLDSSGVELGWVEETASVIDMEMEIGNPS